MRNLKRRKNRGPSRRQRYCARLTRAPIDARSLQTSLTFDPGRLNTLMESVFSEVSTIIDRIFGGFPELQAKAQVEQEIEMYTHRIATITPYTIDQITNAINLFNNRLYAAQTLYERVMRDESIESEIFLAETRLSTQ